MKDLVKYIDNHDVNQRQRMLHSLRKGDSYVYHRGIWLTCDGRIKGTVKHLKNSGEITLVQRRIGDYEYDLIAQGLIES